VICNYAGKRGLSASRRAVKDDAGELVSRNGAAQKPALSDNVILTDVFVKIARPHTRG
jgi:hypothetical protein